MMKENNSKNIINESLQKVAKGGALVFIGTIISLLLSFIATLLLIRNYTTSDYGIFSLAYAILNIFVLVSTLGLKTGVSRSIALNKDNKNAEIIPKLIFISVILGLFLSLILALILFLLSDYIAVNVFHDFNLILPLKIYSLAIPFYNFLEIITSVFIGFDDVRPRVFFEQVLISALFPAFLVLIIAFKQPFINIFYFYVLGLVIACLVLLTYSIKKLPQMKFFPLSVFKSPVTKELLIFSIPLLVATILNLVMSWSDILLIGIIKTSNQVGLYSAVRPLAQFVAMPYNSILLIHMPIFAGLYAKKLFFEMKRNYIILTKWFVFLSLPIFMILFLFPENIINFFFGSSYVEASNVLRILSLGFIFNCLTGPNTSAITSMGKSNFYMFSSFIAAIFSIVFNILLIPYYGIDGAAFSFTLSLTVFNVIKSLKIYKMYKIQPLSKKLIKPTVFYTVLIALIYLLLIRTINISMLIVIILFVLFYIIFFITILVTKSLDQEDLELLISLQKRTGLKLNRLNRFLQKFI